MGLGIAEIMATQAAFCRSGNQVTRTIGGETLVVPIRAQAADLESLYVFNGSGAAIWRLLESPQTVTDLAQALAADFEVAGHPVVEDVTHFIEMLQEAGLIEIAVTP